mmetsp:Transcript_36979/g.56652  ORF Transcript_36979/g.56652 Transcript_36979/m.56652 type:complete len:109 (+) Transcript_36979:2439-2765(+)
MNNSTTQDFNDMEEAMKSLRILAAAQNGHAQVFHSDEYGNILQVSFTVKAPLTANSPDENKAHCLDPPQMPPPTRTIGPQAIKGRVVVFGEDVVQCTILKLMVESLSS